jgi:hypothetical protein
MLFARFRVRFEVNNSMASGCQSTLHVYQVGGPGASGQNNKISKVLLSIRCSNTLYVSAILHNEFLQGTVKTILVKVYAIAKTLFIQVHDSSCGIAPS